MGSCLSRGAVPQNKVVPEFDQGKEYLGERGFNKTIKNKSGLELFAYFWPADPNVPLKGIVQLSHGNTTYTCFDYLKFQGNGKPNLYAGSWVAAMNAAGFAVCGLDHQGCGRSKGERSVIGRFQEHVDNLLLLADHVKEHGGSAFPAGRPHFLMGHSMGGLVAVLASVQQPGRFAGLVLLAPMLSLEHVAKENGSFRPVIKVISAVAPQTEVGGASSAQTRHVPWIYDAWEADPLVYDGGMRARAVEEFLRASEQLCAPGGMEAVAAPLLVFQSDSDTHVEPDGARKLHQRAASTDKTLRMLTRQWHVLTKEEGWEELLQESVAWLVARALRQGGLLEEPLGADSPAGGGGGGGGEEEKPAAGESQNQKEGTEAAGGDEKEEGGLAGRESLHPVEEAMEDSEEAEEEAGGGGCGGEEGREEEGAGSREGGEAEVEAEGSSSSQRKGLSHCSSSSASNDPYAPREAAEGQDAGAHDHPDPGTSTTAEAEAADDSHGAGDNGHGGEEAGGKGEEAEEAATEGPEPSGTAAKQQEEELKPNAEAPVLTRSMSALERLPEVESSLPGRNYSFSGQQKLPVGTRSESPSVIAPSGGSTLAPLPPLKPLRSLGALSPEVAALYSGMQGRPFGPRSKLPPLLPLLDRKPLI